MDIIETCRPKNFHIHSFTHSLTHSINQSVNQSISQSINQSVSQSINQNSRQNYLPEEIIKKPAHTCWICCICELPNQQFIIYVLRYTCDKYFPKLGSRVSPDHDIPRITHFEEKHSSLDLWISQKKHSFIHAFVVSVIVSIWATLKISIDWLIDSYGGYLI